MLPSDYHEFLLASVGASASFIGLLFVALTLVLGRLPEGSSLAERDKRLAESSYTALITIFFISMVALLPGANVAWAMVAIGWIGMASSLRQLRGSKASKPSRNTTVVSSLTTLYFALIALGLYDALANDDVINLGSFCAIIFILYVVALGRAWSLVGVGQQPQ